MVTVRMVQMAIHQVVHMIAMRHRLMATARSMHMIWRMSGAVMVGRAAIGILRVHRQTVLVHVVAVHVMQMAVMQIVDMALVPNRCVAAAGPMTMVVVGMLVTRAHA